MIKYLTYDEIKILEKLLEINDEIDIKELGLKKSDVYNLIKLNLIVVTYQTKNFFVVKINDNKVDDIKKYIEHRKKEISDEDIDRVLENVYIKDELKNIVKKVIKNKLFLMLYGKAGVGKTEILNALSNLSRTAYFHGTTLKKEDLLQILEDELIEIILINELDKCSSMHVYNLLHEIYDMRKYAIIATANTLRKFSETLRSRMIEYKISYSIDEIINIIKRSLEKEDVHVSEDIIKQYFLKYKDIRKTINNIILDFK